MRRFLTYILALAALASCSKGGDTTLMGDDMGTLQLGITTLRTNADTDTDATYNPLEHLKVQIFNHNDELIRNYESTDVIPTELALIQGQYRIEVTAGERVDASLDKCIYFGEKEFVILAEESVNVEVECKIQNTIVEVIFEDAIANNFNPDYGVWVVADQAVDFSSIESLDAPKLRYTDTSNGYFTLPEGESTISWQFKGEHSSRGEVLKSGEVSELKAGGKYQLTFKYSPDLPGSIEIITVVIDDSTDNYDDTIVFSPDPIIEGEGFDAELQRDFISGKGTELQYNVSTTVTLNAITLTIGSKSIDALNPAADSGVTLISHEATSASFSVSDALFSSLSGGVNPLTISVTDANGGAGSVTTPYRLQGQFPIQMSDYNLWSNTITLRAMVIDPEVSVVKLGLRRVGSEWDYVTATKGADDIYTAQFGTVWSERTNEGNLKVHTPDRNRGVFAGAEYEYSLDIDGAQTIAQFNTHSGVQRIQDGDMESSSLPQFSKDGSENSSFWGSGNDATSGLCVQSTKTGMGGSHCALLQPQLAPIVNILAAGNMFTAKFKYASFTGTVYFGVPYAWQARPTALRLKLHATVGEVDKGTASDYEYIKDGHDRSRIFVTLMDWTKTHETSSSTGDPNGVWDPVKQNKTDEGPIIGYGSLLIKDDTAGDAMVTVDIPINYYDKVTKPSKSYTLVISMATSAYGDYKVGSTTNKMYVDDLEWVY